MTEVGPTSQRPQDTPAGDRPRAAAPEVAGPPPSSAADRASRLNAANMIRSLLPLVVICLLIVGWQAFRQGPDEKVRTVDPSTSVQEASNRAKYPVEAPTGLSSGYRATSARTVPGSAEKPDSVTLQIGYLTPKGRYAGFVESDDPHADALTSVLNGASEKGSAQVAGASWTRETTTRGETALVRRSGDVTIVVTGSADEGELETVAAAVRPYSGR